MCGILGHLAFNEKSRISEQKVCYLNDLMTHRGPDSSGVFLKDNIALAMRRLAIVDLRDGTQPMFSTDRRYTIVFNGEIYNHTAIRDDLVKEGITFKTRSDTEVLLNAYIAYGTDCLHRLNGMFAFAIWDDVEKTLFIARDRMGVKPLYYKMDGDRLLLASELTPFYKSGFYDLQIDHTAVCDYLAYWYICEPRTIYKDVYQLPPGHYALIHDAKMTIHKWWEIPTEKEIPMRLQDAEEEFLHLFEDSIRIRMKVDVPFGSFLSGGIDSGLVTAIAARHAPQRLVSFGIGFKEKSYNELDLAQQTAKRHDIDFHHAFMGKLDAAAIHKVLMAFDEPLGNASFIPTYYLAELAARDLKVVLTGDGADELFGGYPTYQAPYYRHLYYSIPSALRGLGEKMVEALPVSHSRLSLDFRLKQFIRGVKQSPERSHYAWREISSHELRHQLLQPHIVQELFNYDPYDVTHNAFQQCGHLDEKNRLMFADQKTYLLNDHLRKVDRMTMANSLEAREPFLDYRIVEFASRMPSDLKLDFFKTKKFLKHVARNFLPAAVIRGKKKGLTSPIASWIAQDLRGYVSEQLQGGLVDQLFQKDVLNGILKAHEEKRMDYSRLIWGILSLQVWHQRSQSLT